MLIKMLKSEMGMTLIEIMLVVAILGGIMGIVAINLTGTGEKADIELTKIDIANILRALDMYKLHSHRYPSTEQGLDSLKDKPTVGKVPTNYQEGGYLAKIPKDKWGQDFRYASPGTHGDQVEVWSAGPDEEYDTDDDIRSWDMDGEESP